MANQDFDLIVIGGGIAGSTLGTLVAGSGARVAVIERETEFRDRNRGEWIAPWGVREARRLGLGAVLAAAGAVTLPALAGRSLKPRVSATPEGDVAHTFFHPRLQEASLQAASAAGAEVIRGARVTAVENGTEAAVTFAVTGQPDTVLTARLAVGADGRTSLARKALGKEPMVHRTARHLAGVRLGNIGCGTDFGYFIVREDSGSLVSVFPQGNGYARGYIFRHGIDATTYATPDGFERYVQDTVSLGVPAEVMEHVTQEGPLASFLAADSWIEHASDGALTLMGDAAGMSDPTWGMGIALALRDASTLSAALLGNDDWSEAIHTYASERDQYWTTIITAEAWQTELQLSPGPEADARRKHAMGLWREDRSRAFDLPSEGPDVDVSPAARIRFFGEDVPRLQEEAPAEVAAGEAAG